MKVFPSQHFTKKKTAKNVNINNATNIKYTQFLFFGDEEILIGGKKRQNLLYERVV